MIGHGFPSVFSQATVDRVGPTLDADLAKNYFKKVLTIPVKNSNGDVVDYIMPDLKNVDLVLHAMRSPDNGDNFTGAGRNPR